MRSKAVGEPPLILAYSMVAAIKHAVTASRVERGLGPVTTLDLPAVCTRVQAAAGVTTQDLITSLN
jgi:xanthine dehydrogenase molybdopterin-binding subunit B